MNKLFATATLGLLTIGSLAIGSTFKVKAVTEKAVLPVEKSLAAPQVIKAEKQDESTEIAYAQVCDGSWRNGVYYYCCIDDSGNWACVW
jgi:uncharacterized protein YbcV (DUF1398 family)